MLLWRVLCFIFGLFSFYKGKSPPAAGENLREIYSQSWYNLYSNAVLDIGDLMVEITSFGSELDVEEKYTEFAEADFENFKCRILRATPFLLFLSLARRHLHQNFVNRRAMKANDPCEVQLYITQAQELGRYLSEDEYRCSLRQNYIFHGYDGLDLTSFLDLNRNDLF